MVTRRKEKGSGIWPYLLLAPALIIMICVVFWPIINAIWMSFQNYHLARPNKMGFILFDNYTKALSSTKFTSSLWLTVLWVVFGVGFQFLFGFLLALLLNKSFKGRGIVRAVSLIPWVTPGVLIALMWQWIFEGNYGVLNDLLLKLNITNEKIAFLAQKSTAFPAVIATIVWQGIPFFALMLLAGLQGIPGELYEAGDIDGASGLQKLFYITIPSLKNSILVTTMLRIIWVANSVDVIFNMTNGGPANSTRTLSVYVYQEASNLNMGFASAMALMLMACLLIVAVPYLKMTFASKEG